MKTIWTETPKGEEAQQEWIGSQSRHRLPMVQITKNGCLKINKPLQELLPPYFQLSYSPQNQELLLRESTLEDGGIRMGKTFVKLLPLSRKLHRCGVELPAYFEVGHVPVGKIWHGKLRQIPDEKLLASIYKDQKKSSREEARCSPAMERILEWYAPLCEEIVQNCAKSIPIKDRREEAKLGLIEAVFRYEPALCTFEEHAREFVRDWLLSANKRYTPAAANERFSADRIRKAEDEEVSLYDLLAGSDDGGMGRWENQQETASFQASLTKAEQEMFQMVLGNASVSEIADRFSITEGHVRSKLMDLVVQWRQFSRE